MTVRVQQYAAGSDGEAVGGNGLRPRDKCQQTGAFRGERHATVVAEVDHAVDARGHALPGCLEHQVLGSHARDQRAIHASAATSIQPTYVGQGRHERASSNPAGVYREVAEEQGASATVVEVDQGEPVPAPAGYDAIISMGGDMGVKDTQAFPWLEEEMRTIREAVQAGMPYWGVCLGSQLLAASLGARVDRLPTTEVGFSLIRLSDAADRDPVFGRLPRPLHAFVWHDDAFHIPEGGVLLGGTAESNQAFRWGEHAYGVQFHLEATTEMVRGWLDPQSRASLERQLGPQGPERLLEELDRRRGEQESTARILAEAWLEGVRRAGAPVRQPELSSGRPD